jgi:hypothetical protein
VTQTFKLRFGLGMVGSTARLGSDWGVVAVGNMMVHVKSKLLAPQSSVRIILGGR